MNDRLCVHSIFLQTLGSIFYHFIPGFSFGHLMKIGTQMCWVIFKGSVVFLFWNTWWYIYPGPLMVDIRNVKSRLLFKQHYNEHCHVQLHIWFWLHGQVLETLDKWASWNMDPHCQVVHRVWPHFTVSLFYVLTNGDCHLSTAQSCQQKHAILLSP